MKTVKGGVSCEFWNSYLNIEIEVEDNATQHEIEEAMREEAIERAGFEWWVEGDAEAPDAQGDER